MTLTYASPSIETILGYSAEAMVGRSGLELTSLSDVEALRDIVSKCSPESGVVAPTQFKLRHRDGSPRDMEARATDLRG